MKFKYITICTPTYNRGYIITQLYHSLQRQCNFNFEWLVIDDGSKDNTEQIFKNDILPFKNQFSIKYIKQENGGKHRAINRAVQEARGDLFFIVDSDDYLTDNATEEIFKWASTLDDSHKWAGVSGLRGYSPTIPIGSFLNSEHIDAKNTERDQFHLQGDKAEVYFTDVLKKYPYPEFPNEKFLTPEVVWNEIAHDNYYIRWFNKIIWICKYLPDGLTNDSEKFARCPLGFRHWVKQTIKIFHLNHYRTDSAIIMYRDAFKAQQTILQTCQDLGINLAAYCRIKLRVMLPSPIVKIYNFFIRK